MTIMYAQLTVQSKPIEDLPGFKAKLKNSIGINLIATVTALQGTIFAGSNLLNCILAAEVIPNKAKIIYFIEGTDTLSVHITGSTLSELKGQSVRVARQLSTIVPGDSDDLKAKTSIFAPNAKGTEEVVIVGEAFSLRKRLTDWFAEKGLSKTLPPAIVFSVAAWIMPGTNAFTSAWIGFFAGTVSMLIEAYFSAVNADDWKWKDVR